MPRYTVFRPQEPSPYSAGVDNMATAVASIFAPPQEDSAAEANRMSAYKSAQEAMKIQQIRDSRDARAAAVRSGDMAALFSNAQYDPEMAPHIPDLNLGAYAAGVPVPTLPAGDQADPLNDPTMARLQMGAKVPAAHTGLGQVFAEQESTGRTRYTADQTLAGTKYKSDQDYAAALDKNAKEHDAKIATGGSTTTSQDPVALMKQVSAAKDELIAAVETEVRGAGGYPPEPALAQDALRIAEKFLADQLALGNFVLPVEAARFAKNEIIRANPAGFTQTDEFFKDNRRTVVPGYKSPLGDVFKPRPVAPKVVQKVPAGATPPNPAGCSPGAGKASMSHRKPFACGLC